MNAATKRCRLTLENGEKSSPYINGKYAQHCCAYSMNLGVYAQRSCGISNVSGKHFLDRLNDEKIINHFPVDNDTCEL